MNMETSYEKEERFIEEIRKLVKTGELLPHYEPTLKLAEMIRKEIINEHIAIEMSGYFSISMRPTIVYVVGYINIGEIDQKFMILEFNERKSNLEGGNIAFLSKLINKHGWDWDSIFLKICKQSSEMLKIMMLMK